MDAKEELARRSSGHKQEKVILRAGAVTFPGVVRPKRIREIERYVYDVNADDEKLMKKIEKSADKKLKDTKSSELVILKAKLTRQVRKMEKAEAVTGRGNMIDSHEKDDCIFLVGKIESALSERFEMPGPPFEPGPPEEPGRGRGRGGG